MLKEQESQYLDANVEKVFHFLELHGHHNFLIGSQNIRNILYANDYDLNANVGIDDSVAILRSLYKEFLHIFNEAYADPEYYILDFKCGVHGNEPIRWSYEDMKRGYVERDKTKITFEQCMLMDQGNVIKLDLCYVFNGIFTDVNCMYNLHIVTDKKHLKQSKEEAKKSTIQSLREEIDVLEREGEFFKALKRYFSIGVLEGKVDDDVLDLLNSEYGILYKFISFLKLVVEMMDQDFKEVTLSLVRNNLEYIKQFASHIVHIHIDSLLHKLIKIIKMSNFKKMKPALNAVIDDATALLNKEILPSLPP